MTTDFRALCAELLAEMDEAAWGIKSTPSSPAIDRARAALAEGDGVGVTEAELIAFARNQSPWREWMEPDGSLANAHFELAELLRAAISRFGPYPRPIPVAERLPTEADCDGEGRCWVGSTSEDDPDMSPASWELCPLHPDDHFWLPAAAIPLPEASP